MSVGEVFRTAVGYIPVFRVVFDICSCIIRLSSGSITTIESQIKQIESISRWLKDNDVNTFSEYYNKFFDKE